MSATAIFHQHYLCDERHITLARLEVLHALGAAVRVSPQKLLDFEIALGELLQNIVRHEKRLTSTCEYQIEVLAEGANLRVNITDECELIADTTFLEVSRTPSDAGGMGINLIKKIASTYTIDVVNNKNFHQLIFNDFLTPT